jgi:type IV pilus biogenesis protein PilP
MPCRKLSGLALGLLLAASCPAAEPATEESPFKVLASSIARLHVLAMQEEEIEARRKLEAERDAARQIPGTGSPKPKAHPTAVLEIGGAESRYLAVIRLPDGSVREFGAGELVPGLGRIKSIKPAGVEDARGQIHPVEGER